MKKLDLIKLQQEIEKSEKRRKGKKQTMKVSGASVKNLRRIIIKKTKG